MTASAALLAFAGAVAGLAPVALRRATWLDSSPRVGIVLWQLASASVVVSAMAGAATLCLSLWSEASPAAFVRMCMTLLSEGGLESPMELVGAVGVSAAAAVGLRLTYCAGASAVRIRRERQAQRRRLTLLAHRDQAWPNVAVIDSPDAAAFCIPGRRGGTVVVSTGTLVRLASDEVRAVLAHERAHLRGRHGLVVWAAQSLRNAFGFIPLFRAAAEELPRLVEMAADDVATRQTGRRVLAGALLHMAQATAPDVALSAGGSTVASRVRRLVQPSPISHLQRSAALTAGVLLAGSPVATFAVALGTGCQFVMSA